MGLATATCDTMTPQVGVFSRHSVANCVPCDTRCIGYQVYKICTTGRLYNSCKKQVRVGRKLGRIRGISANTYCNGRETGSVNGYNLEGINNEMRMVGLEGTFGATGSGSRDSFSHNGNTGDALANRGGLDELLQSQDAGPVLPGINAAALCQTIKLTQEKNLELQKQLNETVGLLAAAAKALETYQATTVVDIPDDGVKGDAVGVDPERITAITPDQEDAAEGETEVTEACVMQHPGVVCCTKTTVLRNSDSETCTLTIQTVAQRDIVDGMECPTAAVNMPHLAALAAQALVASASEFSQRNNRGLAASVYTARRMDRHKQIKKVLQQGKVVEVLKTNKSEFGHENFVVLLEDSNLVIKAMFKPRVTGDGRGWHRVPIEAVAYKLNLLLGMDYVPPVAYRTRGVDVDYRHFSEGAFMYFAHNSDELKKYDEATWGIKKEVLLSDIRILDVLLHNSDRHHGHILMGEHWVEGTWEDGCYKGFLRPLLIDHAAGFRREAVVTMQHENAFQTGPVRCVSARTYLRLRFLDAATIASSFSQYLSEREMRDLLVRRNTILRYLDQLVLEQGYNATVVE